MANGIPTPKQKGRIRLTIDKSAKSPGTTTLDYRGLFVGEFAPGSKKSSLDAKDELVQIKGKGDLGKALEALEPTLKLNVNKVYSKDKDSKLKIDLRIKSMNDFHPDAIVRQIPELKRILEFRQLLKTLKVKVLQDPRFKKQLEDILNGRGGTIEDLRKKLGPLEDAIFFQGESESSKEGENKKKNDK